MTSSKNRQRGYTLLETIGVIVIGLVVVASINLIAQLGVRSVRISSLVDELNMVTSAMNAKYGGGAKLSATPYTAATTTDVVASMGGYAVSTQSGRSVVWSVTTPFATALTIAPGNLFGTAGDSYQVQLTVPGAACADAINNESTLFNAIAVGTANNYVMVPTGVAAPPGVTAGQPPDPKVVSANCPSQGSVVIFYYRV